MLRLLGTFCPRGRTRRSRTTLASQLNPPPVMPTDSLHAALTRIGEFRVRNSRESRQVLEDGVRILEAEDKLLKRGDDGE